MSSLVSSVLDSVGKAIGVISKNIDEQIAECKDEIAELEGDGTIISAIMNFAKEGGKALFSLASSSDNAKKDPENKDKKLTDLKTKLADLLEKKKSQGQDKESSDYPDKLSDDELNGDLADYVNQLDEAKTPYEVVRGKGGMIGIKTTTRGSDSNSMCGMLKGLMKEVGGKMLDYAANRVDNPEFDEATKSQLSEVVEGLQSTEGGINFDDKDTKKSVQKPESGSQIQGDKKWYDGDQVLDAIRNGANMDRDDKNDNSELLGVTQSEIFEMQIENAKAIADKGKTALMPINIDGNHWVAGAMTKDQDGKYQMIHNDSLGNPINEKLSETLRKSGVGIVDLQQRQQEDSYNCGPCAADNLVKFSKAIEASKESGGLDIASKEFKKGLGEELVKDGDEIRKGQNLSPSKTPKTVPQDKGRGS